jgi:diguanylate cyclase (GGDEF)-like protein
VRVVGIVLLAVTAFATLAKADESAWTTASRPVIRVEPVEPGRLPWTVFDERAGLPQNTVVDLLSDPQGFIWAATQDGAARYNGRAWETIKLPERMGSYARVMKVARDGGIWIGTFDGGVAHWRQGRWTIIDSSNGLPSNRIRGLLVGSDARGASVLWIATDKGVARLQDGKVTAYGEAQGLPSLDTEALCETVSAHGIRSLLVGTAQGLARWTGERFETVPVPQQFQGHRIEDIVESTGLHGGPALWVASYGAGMGVLEEGQWTLLDTSSGLPSNVEVLTASKSDDGSPALWIGSEGGLLRFEHGRFTLYGEGSGLPTKIIWKVLETTSPGGLKTVWLGTWGSGIVRLSPNVWRGFDASLGMPAGAVTSMLISRDPSGAETIWAGTADGGLAYLQGGRFESVPLPAALQHAIVFSLIETQDDDGGNSIWVSSFGGGIGRLKAGKWTVFDPTTLPNERVYQLLQTRSEQGKPILWAATEGGLGRYQDGAWTYYRAGSGLPGNLVTQVLETVRKDGARTIWAGTSDGIAQFEDGRWRVFGKKSGLGSENISSLQPITDAKGQRWLWAGTFSGGVSRMRLDMPGARWESFDSGNLHGLPSDTVLSVSQDKLGRIYLATTRGITRLTAREPTAADPSPFATEVFTSEDGLPSSDCQQAARMVDARGRIWVGTSRGLAMFDPGQEHPDLAAKSLWIESAGLSDHSLLLHGGESLSYDQRNLSFSSALLAWGDESRIRYRYQLVGFDPAPSEWTASGVKEYTNLGAGDYEFRVWARDARGHVSGPERLAFHVRPAPWLSPWAYAGYVLLALALAWAVLQWRLRALAHRTRLLEGMVAERTHDLVAARDQLEQLATTDALTGLANRRKFDSSLQREWGLARRDGHCLSLALLDVDFFKRYNDHYGHAGGDECLRAVAQALAAQCTRPTDLAARYGGEEFVLVLPETDTEGACALLKAILAAVDALRIDHADSICAPHVTISLGAVTLRPGTGSDPQAALERADHLLYQAKESGRHQAVHEDEAGRIRTIMP